MNNNIFDEEIVIPNYSIGLSDNYSSIKPAILEGGIAKFIRSYPEYVESVNASIGLK